MAESYSNETGTAQKRKRILFFVGGVCALAALLFGGIYFGSNGGERLSQTGDVLFGGGSFNELRDDPVEPEDQAQEVARIPGDGQTDQDAQEQQRSKDDEENEADNEIAAAGAGGSANGSSEIPETGIGAGFAMLLPVGMTVLGIVEYYRSRSALLRAAMNRSHLTQQRILF